MLDVMSNTYDLDVDGSPRVIVGPTISVDASSVTDFTNHSALRSIMTNYDYTQYDASAARREELRAALAAAELGDYVSILDDGGFGIHKSRPVAADDDEDDDDDDDDDDEFSAPNTPQRQFEVPDSGKVKRSSALNLSIDSHGKKKIERTPEASSQASPQKQKGKKSPGSKIFRILFKGKKAKGGINANKEKFAATETDASSRQLDPSPFSDEAAETPIVNNASDGRRTHSFLVEPPIIPIASPHIAPRKERANQLLRKINAIKEDEGSASTARLTDEDTSEGDANSTSATRETKESAVDGSYSFHTVDDATQKIYMDNIVNYNSFFSAGSGDVSVARTSSTPFDETESKSGIVPSLGVMVQVQPKQSLDSGLARIHNFDSRELSSDFYDVSLESATQGSASFDTIDSVIRKETCACGDPCGIGEIMEDIHDGILDIANVFNSKSVERKSEGSKREGRYRSHGKSKDYESKPKRATRLRFENVKSQRRLT